MITDLKQIVVQDESLAGEKRSFVQHGADILQIKQFTVAYEELTVSEKATWDDFVNLLKSKG